MISKKYTFYPQTGFSFVFSFVPTNNFFSGNFSFLNSQNKNSIIFNSGQIKNNNGDFVSSYNQPYKDVIISGNVSLNNFNYYIDNKLIYLETGEYGFCSGVEFNTNKTNNNDISYIRIYGDKPSYSVYNDKLVFSNQPINCYLSGSSTNIQPFDIYEIHVGGTLDANLGYSNYVPRDYFEISGQNIFDSGISINPGDVFSFTINQIGNIYSRNNGYIYIPIYMETSFGTVYFVFFTKIIDINSIESMYIRNATDISSQAAVFSSDILFDPLKESVKNFFVYISGVDGNNFSKNGITDTFTGSWNIEFEDIDFYPQIIETKNILLFNNINNSMNFSKSGEYYNFIIENDQIVDLSGISTNQILINSGIYNGIIFNVPDVYNTRFDITGINFGIYSTGIFTGIKTEEVNSKISGGNIDISIYEIGSDYKFLNKIGNKNIIINNIYDTGIDSYNLYSITGKYSIYTNKNYALVFSGYSSGYAYGYDLFLPTGDLNYENNNIQYTGSVSGFSDQILNSYSAINLNKVPLLNIIGNKITDNNILSGGGNINFRNEIDNPTFRNITIFKIYNFNNENSYTGSAFLYISGHSGYQKSGYLTVYKDMFRQIQANMEIF